MAVTLFAYRRGTTPMHRTSALLKLPFLMALCICTFTNGPHEIIRTGICLAVSIVLFLLSGAHLQSLKQLAFVPVLGALVTLFGTLCLPPSAGTATANNGDIITVLPFLALSLTGLKAGILYTVRFFAKALEAQVVFETTSSIQIKDALESAQNAIARIFPPLRKLNPALVISLAINLDRKSTRLNSSHQIISYAVFCLKKKKKNKERHDKSDAHAHDTPVAPW